MALDPKTAQLGPKKELGKEREKAGTKSFQTESYCNISLKSENSSEKVKQF